MESHTYTIKVEQINKGKIGAEGRIGTLIEPKNSNFPQITVQSPGEFKGPVDSQQRSLNWTPEDLFVASAAVCYFTTFIAIAERSNLNFKDIEIKAIGTLEKGADGKDIMSQINEEIMLTIENEQDREKALKVLQKSEANCLIANSMKSKIHPNYQIHI